MSLISCCTLTAAVWWVAPAEYYGEIRSRRDSTWQDGTFCILRPVFPSVEQIFGFSILQPMFPICFDSQYEAEAWARRHGYLHDPFGTR